MMETLTILCEGVTCKGFQTPMHGWGQVQVIQQQQRCVPGCGEWYPTHVVAA